MSGRGGVQISGRASDLATVDGALAGAAPLPRANGELVFEEPWQGRALGMAVVALDRLGVPWADFRRHLANAIAQRPTNPEESPASAYYAAWLDALEALLAERDLGGLGNAAHTAAAPRPRRSAERPGLDPDRSG